MAVAAKDIPVTRAMVYGWLVEYDLLEEKPEIREFLAGKLNELDLHDTVVDTSAHESLGDTTPLLEMIVEDLPSYGFKDL